MKLKRKETRSRPQADGDRAAPVAAQHSEPALRPQSARPWPLRLALLALLAAGLISYASGFQADFVFDGQPYILDNRDIRALWPPRYLFEYTRPLVYLTFALNYALTGPAPWSYFAVNLAIHLGAAGLLFGIVRRSLDLPQFRERFGGQQFSLAFATALLWMLHPLQTQSVTYIYQRLESLVSLFILLTLYCFIRSLNGNSVGWRIASVAACAAGMTCKELMAVAPALILWYDRALVAGSWRELQKARWRYYACLFATVGILVAIMVAHASLYPKGGIGQVKGLTWWEYALTQPGVILYYVRLWCFPVGQCLDYGWLPASTALQIVPPLVVIVVLLGLVGLGIWRQPALGFLGGWFFLLLAPTSSVVPIADMIFEHRVYLASVTLAALTVFGLAAIADTATARFRWPSGRSDRAFWTGIVTLSLAWGALTFMRNHVYHSEIAMWSDVASKVPNHARGWCSLGISYAKERRFAEGSRCFERAIDLDPDWFWPHLEYALLLTEAGDFQQAHKHLIFVLVNEPQQERGLMNMAHLMVQLGRHDEAIEKYEQLLKMDPDDSEWRIKYSSTLVLAGRHQDAVAQCQRAIELEPGSVGARVNLAHALAAMGRPAEAIRQCNDALTINPKSSQAHATLAKLLEPSDRSAAQMHMFEAWQLEPKSPEVNLGMGNMIAADRPRQAIRYFETALEYRPKYPEAHFNLANAFVACREPQSAIPHLQAAVELRPDWTEAIENLRVLRAAVARQ